MLCSNVHVCRPSVSTSGGQSAGGCVGASDGTGLEREADFESEEDGEGVEEDEASFLVMAAHAAKDVQDRHPVRHL